MSRIETFSYENSFPFFTSRFPVKASYSKQNAKTYGKPAQKYLLNYSPHNIYDPWGPKNFMTSKCLGTL